MSGMRNGQVPGPDIMNGGGAETTGQVWLKRAWGWEVETSSVWVAIGVKREGYREALGVVEGYRRFGMLARIFSRPEKIGALCILSADF